MNIIEAVKYLKGSNEFDCAESEDLDLKLAVFGQEIYSVADGAIGSGIKMKLSYLTATDWVPSKLSRKEKTLLNGDYSTD